MSGVGRRDGKPLDDWAHVVQSIGVILTTPIGSRVMRRDFGSDLPGLLDRPLNADTIVDAVMATAEALDRWEPRFALEEVAVDRADGTGRLALSVTGVYRPLGQRRSAEIVL